MTPPPIGQRLSKWRESIRSTCRQWAWPVYRRRLQRSSAPILVGPFIGEVGLEALYWQPFVDALRDQLQIDPARLIPITRSGAGAWYGCPTTLEIYAMRDVRAVRVENRVRVARTGMVKQMAVTPFDRELYADAAETLKLSKYLTLHPAWMYQTMQPFFHGQRGVDWAGSSLRYAPLPKPAMTLPLPPNYLAVSFYARATWPASPITAQYARETIAMLAQQMPVVILSTGLHVDDHVDYLPNPLPANVIRLHDVVPSDPQHSLAVMSAALAGAQGFVGTYGGLSHLALRYGIPSVNLYTEWKGILHAHKQMSDVLALSMGVPYHVVPLGQIPLLQRALPQVIMEPAGSSGFG